MFFYEDQRCPVCREVFLPTDDIVSCPDCGLPHHRACWREEGHCHLSHLHGTPQQWSRQSEDGSANSTEPERNFPPNVKICPSCHTANPEFSEYCKRCGTQLDAEDWHTGRVTPPRGEYTPFSSDYRPARENVYSASEPILDHRADELAAVVGSRTSYYMPHFRQMHRTGSSGGWNWAAFFFGPYWLLYRKMYLSGSLLLALNLIQNLITTFVLDKLGITTVEQIQQFATIAAEGTDRVTMMYMLSISAISTVVILLRFLLGGLGNKLYYRHCSGAIRKARERTPDLSAGELASVGGTSIILPIIGYVALEALTNIMLQFL